MTGQLIVDLGEDGTASVSTLAGNAELPAVGMPARLSWPLDGNVLEGLQWYLEDYLTAPYGVYEDKGARIGASLREWGEQVFLSVFGSGSARDAYLGMRARGDVELVFRSASPSLLGLPWELMADPARDRPLALEVAGVGRSLPVAPDAAQTVAVPGGKLRVLMVISRPGGDRDVGYRMIARPLLERLEAVRGVVDLMVLRPPTLEALRAELAAAVAAGTPYQVVHFDGHGFMPGRPGGAGSPLTFAAPAGEGVLVFEKPGGGADHVPASRVAQVLTDAKVPVVVLNACQSAAVGKELEAAVATQLLREGVASVVAMAYSVYAVAAAEFMAAFYERLFAGGTVSSAVTVGRQQMFRSPGRPSPKGDLPLADWLVPVHYLRRDVSFPQAVTSRAAGLPSLAQALETVSAAAGQPGLGDLDPVGGVFVGRDALFYDLEAAARLQKVVVLVGPGGTGKTELVKAFARWWRDTGGVERPDWVFWHSFEPGIATFGLDGVINEIGLRLYGEQFWLLEPEQRRAVVLDALAKHRMLLVWDNFESVRSMPDPGHATPPLDDAGCTGLREFLAAVATHGHSAVLVTSRTAEDWLGDIRRLRVGGLAAHEAAQYADILLAPYPAARKRRETRAFGDLMAWLGGHPLSMRLVLPRLDSDNPEALLAGLQGSITTAGRKEEDADRTQSLAATVAYSYAHLTSATRRLLPAVSLFHGVADTSVLAVFSQAPQAPRRFAGQGKDEWAAALDDAARVGLLASLGRGIYQVHPALPGYLAAAWQAEEPDYADARAQATSALLDAHAAQGEWLDGQISAGDAGFAFAVIRLERRTIGSLLGHAIDHGLWEATLAILQPLDRYWDARGLDAEAGALTDRVREATVAMTGAPPQLDTPAGTLWLFATGIQANRELERHHLDRAESAYRQVLATLQAMDASLPQQHHMATTYHQLATVAQHRGQLDAAEDWTRRSLAINEELGNRPGMATGYHQLGMVTWHRGQLDAAQDWTRKAVAINEELGNRPDMATGYHQLGMLAHKRGELDAAEDWYRKSLAISEELGNRRGLAISYHQMGIVAWHRGQLHAAEDCYRKSLVISEELGNQPEMVISYHQLGMVAQGRGELDAAEDWYRKSLAISYELGNRRHLANSYHQLGMVALLRGHLDAAQDLTSKALVIAEELGNRSDMASGYHQLGMVAQGRGELDAAEGWYRKSLAISEELEDRPGMALTHSQAGSIAEQRGQLEEALACAVRCVSLFEEIPHPSTGTGPRHLARLTSQLGMTALEATWKRVTGRKLPKTVRDYVSGRIQEESELNGQ